MTSVKLCYYVTRLPSSLATGFPHCEMVHVKCLQSVLCLFVFVALICLRGVVTLVDSPIKCTYIVE
jgi:hypothetical protein